MDLIRTTKFKERFNQYYPLLCRIAFTYIPDQDECEDIVQTTFVSIWNKEKDLLPEKEFASYMVISVKNNCISFLRKQHAETVPLDDTHIAETVASDPEPEDELLPAEKLRKALDVLPPKCREVFLMSKLYGMKYREIAQELEISEKTVENQMGKAIRMLRQFAASHPHYLLLIMLLSIFLKTRLR